MKYAILSSDYAVVAVVNDKPPVKDPYSEDGPSFDPYDPYAPYYKPWYPDFIEITDQEGTDITNASGGSHIDIDAYGDYTIYEDTVWFDKMFYDQDPERYTENLKRRLAISRYTEEVGGLDIGNGVIIKSDRDTQSVLTGARILAKENPAFSVDWKLSGNNFTTLDSTAIISAADTMAIFIQLLFTKEAQLNAAIDAAQTYEDISTITW